MEIRIKCKTTDQANAILEHFKNEHEDLHRYAYLMFSEKATQPEDITVQNLDEYIQINLQ
jgi:hypothetical protein